jgi:dTDP-glucose pyrophosphorylase
VEIDGLTEGAACTVLMARDLIDDDSPLMIANSDQYVDVDIDSYLGVLDADGLDGLIMTMWADDKKWSYVGLDETRMVTQVVEKEVISNEATVGIYNFRHGRSFVAAADSMIAGNERVNNEFYVAPTYNPLIRKGARVGIHSVGRVGDGMYGLGTPADLREFLAHPISRRTAATAT